MRDTLGHGTYIGDIIITKFIFSGLYIMKEKYIQLIDEALKNSVDYNWPTVREAVQNSIIDNNFTVLYEYINCTLDSQVEVRDVMNNTFWNGIYVALLSKPSN